MSIKPLLRAAKLFLAKRGNIGQKDVNTIAPPKSVSVFTGDTYTHELDAEEKDEIPVLRATEHAPVLEGVFADLFREEGAVPPFCHVLICQASPEVDQPPELHLEFTFHDATDELDKFEEKKQKFDFEMDPPSDSPDDLCYAVFLFVCGSPANIEEIIEDKAFEGIHVIDVSDDSELGFPGSVTVWTGHVKSPATAAELLMVAMMPEMEIADDLEDEDDERQQEDAENEDLELFRPMSKSE